MPFFPPVTPPESGGSGGGLSGPGNSQSELGRENDLTFPGGTGVRPLYPTAYWRTFNVTTTYTIGEAFNIVRGDATAAGFTVTLPASALYRGGMVSVMKTDAGGNVVTVAAATGDTLWSATTTLTTQYACILLISADDGAGGYGWQKAG